MLVFWLVLVTAAVAPPLHVGNFPSMEACEAAAVSTRQTVRSGAAIPNFQLMCIQANTGRAGDPAPPECVADREAESGLIKKLDRMRDFEVVFLFAQVFMSALGGKADMRSQAM